ncbi:MAG: hypothetical protein QM817_06715 [Archangium sp.]
MRRGATVFAALLITGASCACSKGSGDFAALKNAHGGTIAWAGAKSATIGSTGWVAIAEIFEHDAVDGPCGCTLVPDATITAGDREVKLDFKNGVAVTGDQHMPIDALKARVALEAELGPKP